MSKARRYFEATEKDLGDGINFRKMELWFGSASTTF